MPFVTSSVLALSSTARSPVRSVLAPRKPPPQKVKSIFLALPMGALSGDL